MADTYPWPIPRKAGGENGAGRIRGAQPAPPGGNGPPQGPPRAAFTCRPYNGNGLPTPLPPVRGRGENGDLKKRVANAQAVRR
jgi:hypothetical protein